MTIEQIIERNYQATVNRGLITESTNVKDFVLKLYEEVSEVQKAKYSPDLPEELSDVILVALAMAKHYDIDILSELEKKVIKNEKRAKNDIQTNN